MIAIVDYGLGNLGSVANMLRKLGVDAEITSDHDALRRARGLILPGVGHFDEGMRNLEQRGLRAVLDERVLSHEIPVLGICLGMQLLGRRSEEGSAPGLGWIAGDVKRFVFAASQHLPIPHMGWNEVDILDEPLLGGVPSRPARFYFVHSYYMVCDDPSNVAATCNYGGTFTAAVHRDHIYGTQFHPEKSHKFGLAVLSRFASIVADGSHAA